MINEALRLIRLYWGLTQSEMAKRLDISQSLISEIEGGNKTVTIDIIEKYSNSMGIKMSQLLIFAEEVGDQPASMRGKLFIAENVLNVLERLKPNEPA